MKYLIIVPGELNIPPAVLQDRAATIGRIVPRDELETNTGEDWFPDNTFGVELDDATAKVEAMRLYNEITKPQDA